MSAYCKRMMAGAVAIGLGLGCCAASASAFSISGTSGNPYDYTSNSSSTHRFTFAGSYSITCSGAVFRGTVTGGDSTNFAPTFTVCPFYGFPFEVTQSGAWNLKVTSDDGLSTPTWYYGNIAIPAGVKTTFTLPIAGCKVEITGSQSFVHGAGGNIVRARNDVGFLGLEIKVNSVAFTATSCPFSSGVNGVYDTGNAGTYMQPTKIPGVGVD